MSILHAAERRYATKAFDPAKPLTAEQIATLKAVLRLSPSSINYQPWHFFIANTEEAKAKVAKACPEIMAYNAKKIMESPLVIVFCAHNEATTEGALKVVAQEQKDGRYPSEEAHQARAEMMSNYVANLNADQQVAKNWMEKQTYIALGQVLLAAADMGIDSVPIEGFDNAILDEKLDLHAQGLHSTVIAAFGHHSDADFNANLPKSRFSDDKLFTEL